MHVFIINPVAGKGKGKKVVDEFLNEHPRLRTDCKTFYTKHEGHATTLAEQVASMHHKRLVQVIVVGGDGTMYEVLNGLKAFPNIPIAFVPVGSGNDFARGTNGSLNPKRQLRQLFGGMKARPFWFGTYRSNLTAKEKAKLFASTIGFGFDAEIVEWVDASQTKKLLNKLRLSFLIYIIGILSVLVTFKPKNFQMRIDGKAYQLSNVWLVTVSNHPYFGGGMKIAPQAKNHPRDFEITVVHNISKLKVLFMFMTIFIGKHTGFQEVETFRGSSIEINSEHELSYQSDGVAGRCYRSFIEKESQPRQVKRNSRKS